MGSCKLVLYLKNTIPPRRIRNRVSLECLRDLPSIRLGQTLPISKRPTAVNARDFYPAFSSRSAPLIAVNLPHGPTCQSVEWPLAALLRSCLRRLNPRKFAQSLPSLRLLLASRWRYLLFSAASTQKRIRNLCTLCMLRSGGVELTARLYLQVFH